MRKISNYSDELLRQEQFDVLIDTIDGTKSKNDLLLLLSCFLTESESAYLAQRLNIMRMLAKNFSYLQISEKISASPSTIATAKRCLEKGGEQLRSVILSYKYRPRASNKTTNNLVHPHMPGNILHNMGKSKYNKHDRV